jgi:prolyl-tRNA editing enzyme YbaK/EbsC (Cys-tRNA(Pro) deacylase)
MMTFAMLTRLSPDASHAPGRLRLLEREVIHRIEAECPSLRWIANYVVIGNHNYFDLFSVPDMESALKVSLIVAAFGPAETEIWPLLAWEEVKHVLDGNHDPRVDGDRASGPARRVATRAPAAEPDKGGLADAAIAYLRRQGAAFRLTNFPVAETQPVVAHALRPGAHEVTTRVILVDGQPALACLPQGAAINIASLGGALGAHVLEATTGDLPGDFRRAPEPIPPLGHLLGVPLYVDEQLASSTVIAFEAFSSGVSVQLAYEEFARIEEPRTVPIAARGSLTPSAPISTHMRP